MTLKNYFFALLVVLISLSVSYQAQAQIDLRVGGYIQTWYVADQHTELSSGSELNNSGFRVRRARLTARGSLNETFSATTWLELSGQNNILLDFHMDAHIRPWLNLRFGQFIMPGQSHDTARLVSSRLFFYERPPVTTTLASGMGYDAFRDIGMMVYGTYGPLWYGIHAGNGAGRFNQTGTTITNRSWGSGLYGARIDYTLIDGLVLGGHVSTNQQRDLVQGGSEPFDLDRTSWSIRLATNNLGADRLYTQFEYMEMSVNDTNRGVATIDGAYDMNGFYAEAGYGLTREWHILGRFDKIIQKPGQAGSFRDVPRYNQDSITLGITRYFFHENREIARTYLNYNLGTADPGDLSRHALVLVLQLRFIPV
ncbi:MAG: OprO/OprP family phosphate-selective porin [Candidatus Cyclonatronum sp.]|uniref:porin n=1 Tax=Cyclonatronum sp. TaxID=3024185 RepID=UPI0025BD9365|nr:porin [Cyclonatronum sp.]MCH8485247.1 OprO/OprP family phosphate-selective porin [Cyclonatronum sp.]